LADYDHSQARSEREKRLLQKLADGEISGIIDYPGSQKINQPVTRETLKNRALVITKKELGKLKGITIVPSFSSHSNPATILLEADENMRTWGEEDRLVLFPEDLS